MKKILSLLLCLLISLPALLGAEPRRERVYISTDKEVYVAGDAVWLSAWCLDAGNGRLSDFSKIAYVELHSPARSPMWSSIPRPGWSRRPRSPWRAGAVRAG